MDVREELDKRGIPYVSGSKRVMISCPFHEDENPSCGVWLSNGRFKCFSASCGKEGSFLELLAAIDHVSVREEYRKVPFYDEETLVSKLNRMFQSKTISIVREESFFSTFPEIQKGSESYCYLKQRGLSDDSISLFKIREGMNSYFGRVILPIRNVFGDIIAFTARSYIPNVFPKTKKSGSPHSTFYGLYELLQKVDTKFFDLIIVEGEFDALFLQEKGFHAVANMGTVPFSLDKIRLLRKYANRVILMYDGDSGGYIAMEKQWKLLKSYLPVYCVKLPIGKDPDELTETEVKILLGGYHG